MCLQPSDVGSFEFHSWSTSARARKSSASPSIRMGVASITLSPHRLVLGMRRGAQAACSCRTLIKDSAGMPSPSCSRQIIFSVSERFLFSLTREKLMKIPAFARLYGWYSQAIAWLKATEAWRTLESLARSGREYFKGIAARLAYWIELRRYAQTRHHLKRRQRSP